MGNAITKNDPAETPETTGPGSGRCVNYLVNSYSDVKEVIYTIEKLIAQTPITDKSELRQACEINIIPLQGRSGYVFRVKLHQAVMRQI